MSMQCNEYPQICTSLNAARYVLAYNLAFICNFYHKLDFIADTLVYRIDEQAEINVQVEKFLKKIKRADLNKAVQGGFFSQN